MTHLNFRSTVKLERITVDKKDQDAVLVTAPHPVTSTAWYVLNDMDELGVFGRDRWNETQLVFWPNPGYYIDDVKSLVVPAVYVGIVYENVEDFWKIGLKNHELRYTEYVSFVGAIDRDMVRMVISSWILSKAKTVLDNAYRDQISDNGLNRNFIKSQLVKAEAAANRLRFLNPQQTSLTKSEIRTRLNKVEILIKVLDNADDVLTGLADRAEAIQKNAYAAKKALKLLLEDGKSLATDELYTKWKSLMNSFTRDGAKLKTIAADFKGYYRPDTLEDIEKLCPPACTK